jgi:hypothetical protein
MHRNDLANPLCVEWCATADESEQDASQRIDVRTLIDMAGAATLLGGHVRRRAHHCGRLRLHGSLIAA